MIQWRIVIRYDCGYREYSQFHFELGTRTHTFKCVATWYTYIVFVVCDDDPRLAELPLVYQVTVWHFLLIKHFDLIFYFIYSRNAFGERAHDDVSKPWTFFIHWHMGGLWISHKYKLFGCIYGNWGERRVRVNSKYSHRLQTVDMIDLNGTQRTLVAWPIDSMNVKRHTNTNHRRTPKCSRFHCSSSVSLYQQRI